MSYDLHITKAHHWIQSENNPITDVDIHKILDLLDLYKRVPFMYRDGRITLSGVDANMIGLLIEMANRIDARVQGDDGEYYTNDDNNYPYSPEPLKHETIYTTKIDKQKQFIESLSIHDKIHHPKYGTGKIIEILGREMDTEFLVQFSDREQPRRLLAYYAPIQVSR